MPPLVSGSLGFSSSSRTAVSRFSSAKTTWLSLDNSQISDLSSLESLTDYYYWRGLEYASGQKHGKAIQDFTIAIETNSYPDDEDYFHQRGISHLELHHISMAIRDYNKAIKLSRRGNAMAYNGKGNAYNSLGQYERAIREYSRAININGQIAIFYNNRGDAYAKASAQDQAKARELGYKP